VAIEVQTHLNMTEAYAGNSPPLASAPSKEFNPAGYACYAGRYTVTPSMPFIGETMLFFLPTILLVCLGRR
jgi:hypothetical protein